MNQRSHSQTTAPRPRRSGRYAVTPWAEQHLYRPFIKASLIVALTLGFTTGATILIRSAAGQSATLSWFTYLQAHGVAQLFGWAGLFVTGVAMHVVPRFRGDAPIRFPWPQRAILALVLGGIVLRAAGQIAHGSPVSDALLLTSGLALVAGIAIFAITLVSVLRAGRPSGTPVERWLWTGLGWALAAAVLHLAITSQMVTDDVPVAPDHLNQAFIVAATFGFVTHFILGISLRATAGFLQLRPYHRRLEQIAHLVIETGLLIQVVSASRDSSDDLHQFGALLLAAGLALFAMALRILEPPATPRLATPGTYPRYPWILVNAYLWLLVGAVVIAGSAGANLDWWSWRILSTSVGLHVVTLGFISMTIFGFAARTIPLFEGRVVRHHWLLDLAFATLTASVALRLLASIEGAPGSARILALSGSLGTVALIAFAFAIWPLLRDFPRVDVSRELPVLQRSE